jgi:hypothetical protein
MRPRLPCIRLPRTGSCAGALSAMMILLLTKHGVTLRVAVVAQGGGIGQEA